MRPSLASLVVFLISACASSTGPSSEPLTVTADQAVLRLENLSARRTFYLIHEREGAALINWAPCLGGSGCSSITPGGKAVVPYIDIGGYGPGKSEAIVWWWQAEPGKPIPGEIHAVIVRL